MQEAARLAAVVDRVVVPQERLAVQPVGRLPEVRRRVFGGADPGARPEDVDAPVQPLAEIGEVMRGMAPNTLSSTGSVE